MPNISVGCFHKFSALNMQTESLQVDKTANMLQNTSHLYQTQSNSENFFSIFWLATDQNLLTQLTAAQTRHNVCKPHKDSRSLPSSRLQKTLQRKTVQ